MSARKSVRPRRVEIGENSSASSGDRDGPQAGELDREALEGFTQLLIPLRLLGSLRRRPHGHLKHDGETELVAFCNESGSGSTMASLSVCEADGSFAAGKDDRRERELSPQQSRRWDWRRLLGCSLNPVTALADHWKSRKEYDLARSVRRGRLEQKSVVLHRSRSNATEYA